MNAFLIFFVFLASYAHAYEVSTAGNNVGIGTTVTTGPLEVQGDVGNKFYVKDDLDGQVAIVLSLRHRNNVGIGTNNVGSGLSFDAPDILGNTTVMYRINPQLSNVNNGAEHGQAKEVIMNAGTLATKWVKDGVGFAGFNSSNTPSASVHIFGQSTTVTPLKIADGSLNTSPVADAIENNDTNLYRTNNAGTRKRIDPWVDDSSNANISFSGANVGIGTVNPITALEVSGTVKMTAANIGIGTTSPTRLCIASGVVQTCP